MSQNIKQTDNIKPIEIKCSVGGSLCCGKAMCGYVTVGGKLCTLPRGECEHQELP